MLHSLGILLYQWFPTTASGTTSALSGIFQVLLSKSNLMSSWYKKLYKPQKLKNLLLFSIRCSLTSNGLGNTVFLSVGHEPPESFFQNLLLPPKKQEILKHFKKSLHIWLPALFLLILFSQVLPINTKFLWCYKTEL